MMIDGASPLLPRPAGAAALPGDGRAAPMSNLRFFLTAYAGGLAFFLAVLA